MVIEGDFVPKGVEIWSFITRSKSLVSEVLDDVASGTIIIGGTSWKDKREVIGAIQGRTRGVKAWKQKPIMPRLKSFLRIAFSTW